MTKATYAVLEPHKMNPTFARAFNSGRVENLLSLYESAGQLVRQDGQVDVGLSAIRANLQAFMGLGGTMTSENIYAYQSGDIALLRAKWRLTTIDREGKPLELEGHTTEIVRCQSDGRWLYLVDHPFGAEPF